MEQISEYIVTRNICKSICSDEIEPGAPVIRCPVCKGYATIDKHCKKKKRPYRVTMRSVK